ncbi:spore germination protein GerPE [Sutcliffiella rhizosphaerae]|uniref:Spore germination protein GerPE n=1 Tax=Sutcliffiella rhizosphaerae TaxID=2880967 RepID=A0ABM8YU06_9BACI|nr:spore germination protein GerPE [Sutcliffiella rhizosphaerae]CAG9623460.1 putative spore germination protein GerPE [Sutcliffiella rhizosphaerae]
MRISKVEEINIHSLTFSSYFHIGDSYHINAKSRALAVKREFPRFYGKEGHFSEFPIFSMKLPTPVITENVAMEKRDLNPFINVKTISVKGVSSSSVLQVGSSQTICAESRIKHMRQLLGHEGLRAHAITPEREEL